MTPTLRIIIAEDSMLIRHRLQKLLDKIEGAEVVAAVEDGHRTIEAVRQFEPDVLILDLWIPGLNGLEVLRAVRPEYPTMKIFVCTNYADASTRTLCVEHGADYFFDKASELDAMVRTLQGLNRMNEEKE